MEPVSPPSEPGSGNPVPPPRLRFRPTQKLTGGRQFERAYKRGRRNGDALLQVVVLKNDLPQGRLGMAVSVKACGKAVRRNRIRRILRDTFRQLQHHLAGLDVVVNARPAAKTAEAAALVKSLETLLRPFMRSPGP